MTSDFCAEIGSTYLPKIGGTRVHTLVLVTTCTMLERPACNVIYDITTLIDLFILIVPILKQKFDILDVKYF